MTVLEYAYILFMMRKVKRHILNANNKKQKKARKNSIVPLHSESSRYDILTTVRSRCVFWICVGWRQKELKAISIYVKATSFALYKHKLPYIREGSQFRGGLAFPCFNVRIFSRVTTSTHYGPSETRTNSISTVAEEGQIELISQKLAQNGVNGTHVNGNGMIHTLNKEQEINSFLRTIHKNAFNVSTAN